MLKEIAVGTTTVRRSGEVLSTLAPVVVTLSTAPYVAVRPSSSCVSVLVVPIGIPRFTVPQAVALNSTVMNPWAPAGTDAGGK